MQWVVLSIKNEPPHRACNTDVIAQDTLLSTKLNQSPR